MNEPVSDVLVIGGGINGVGIALDAAGRGLSVTLCEMNDLASATSSASSKLIHGGLRYLEQYEFRLVREALAEREILLQAAPHIIWPLRFRLPHQPRLRPAWMLRMGLWLYDHLARRDRLPGSTVLRLNAHSPLKPSFQRAFEYSDAWVDDARLVVLCAMAARERGARILPRTRCTGASRENGLWRVQLESEHGDSPTLWARALVNAAGPWASGLFDTVLPVTAPATLRLVKGSHMVVPRLHPGDEAYILQHDDGRIVFVLPYEQDFSLIGTTDVDYQGEPGKVSASEKEIAYLCDVVNTHFRRQIHPAEVVHCYAGVRPLMAEGQGQAQRASRDYKLLLNAPPGQAPLLSVFGGKITTFRALAEDAIDHLKAFFPEAGGPWTRQLVLPGGDFDTQSTLVAGLTQAYPWLPEPVTHRYVRSYGTRCRRFLHGCSALGDLGEAFGAGLYARELDYLMQEEWAQTADDVLWRRSKLGLRLALEQKQRLVEYMAARLGVRREA
ncbi:glycerol-3-phosphate dehydrogenase [Oceanimonas sp. GK1]|uniref:glycerol-3-phosphate dehydrogenase n=1 Tax=Oceanimonas sp. (strain GK1 / IBRC-M 10197) TaxID=511062 RepID=UPI0002494EE6|nr:glycerol-3-phosphate dehydrogenase [Oceanimonas sp. GK1]AEY01696.1 glycerol-3-phosphate dehydrogenase [Oceanimonas sp. GK1]